MTFDFSQVTPTQGVITFGEYPFQTQPLEPDQIIETTTITGSPTAGAVIAGSVDTPQ